MIFDYEVVAADAEHRGVIGTPVYEPGIKRTGEIYINLYPQDLTPPELPKSVPQAEVISP